MIAISDKYKKVYDYSISGLVLIILSAYAIFSLFPVYMGLLNAFKTDGEMMNNIMAFPKEFFVYELCGCLS